MHIPQSDTTAVPLIPFDTALALSEQAQTDYDSRTWIYIPVSYTHLDVYKRQASTKAFVSQLMVLYVLAADLAQKRGLLDAAGMDAYLTELKDLTPKAQQLVDQAETYAKACLLYTSRCV